MPEIEEVLPKYLQIASYIRDQIIRGDLLPGQEVPSERELAASWNVARPTAAKALEALRRQGLVESRRGSGSYVRRPSSVARARERYHRAYEHGTMYSAGESVEFLAADVVAGPAHVLDALQLESGERVIRRARLIHSKSNGPTEVSTSWFSAVLAEPAPRLLERERLRGGTALYVESATGRRAAYARDQVAARLATAEDRRLLALGRPSAVLVYRLTILDYDDMPIQFDEATYPPDRWAFRQEYPLDLPAGPVDRGIQDTGPPEAPKPDA